MPIIVDVDRDPKGVPLRGYRIDRRRLHALREEWVRLLPDSQVTTADELNAALESSDHVRLKAEFAWPTNASGRRFALLDIDTATKRSTLALENVDVLPLPTGHMESLSRWRQLFQPHAFLVDRRTAEKRESDRRWHIGTALTVALGLAAVVVPLLAG